MVYFIGNGLLMGLQSAISRVPAVKEWAGIRPPPPASLRLENPTMLETLKAGLGAFGNFNEKKFESIVANAKEKAKQDQIKRATAARKDTKQAIRQVSVPSLSTLSKKPGNTAAAGHQKAKL